jgi:transcription termination/antitermination protein NusG
MAKERNRVTEDKELELEETEAEETVEAAPETPAEPDDEELEPEDRARRLFASYLEPVEKKEPKPAPKVIEPEDAISLSDLLGDVGLDDDYVGDEDDEAPAADDEDEEVRQEGRNWYVVHSYSGYENKVKKNLEHRIESLAVQDKIFAVVVPTEEEIELKDGQRRTVERRIFPGYILVDMIMDEESWYVVRNTPGVTGFVGSVRRPTPLRQRDVDRILKRMRAETPKVKVTFRPGQKVRIADGPFEDFVGAVDEIYPDKGKVRILVSFFGRETPVELDFLQVEKIT